MPKKKYLLITFIIAFEFLQNTFTSSFLTHDVIFIILLMWGGYGWIHFATYRNNPLNVWKNQRFFYWLMGIMVLSTLVPYYTYNQSISEALISQRYNYTIVFLLIFLRILPSENDFKYAIRICAYLSVVLWIISAFFPTFFVNPEDLKEMIISRQEHNSTDIGYASPGMLAAVLYLYIKIQKLFYHPTTKDILIASLFMLFIIAIQNRSTIIGTLPFYILGILYMKTPRKKQFIAFFLLLILAVMPFIRYIYESLSRETELQLNDDNYNRWQALSLYLIEMKNNWGSILLGNGVWSRSGDYLTLMVRNQLERGTYISDIGWLGTYFYYGIFPIIILFYFVIKSLTVKSVPRYLKFYSLWIIMIPTIHSFLLLHYGGAIFYMSYIYLIIYHLKLKTIDEYHIIKKL